MKNKFTQQKGRAKLTPQKKAWKTRRLNLCVVCKKNPRRSKTAKTCCQSCAGKLAWETMLSK